MVTRKPTPASKVRNEQPMLFSTAYTRLLAHELGLEEHDWGGLLADTQVPVSLLQDSEAFLSLHEQKVIIRNALALSSRPGLGLRLGSKLHLIAHGPLGVAASSAPNVGAGLDVMLRFQSTRAQFVTLSLHRKPGLSVRLAPHLALDPVGIFLMEAMVASFRCSTDFLLGETGLLQRYCFGFPAPAHADLYGQYLQGECEFDQPHTEIPLPHDILHKRSLFADSELHRQSLQHCQRIEQELKQQQCLGDQIRKRIRQQQFQCRLEDIAEQFNMCPRTLIRRLKREDTSFRDILDQELKAAATEHLQYSNFSVETIAGLLGYQQPVNFRRAFQRWFGMSPSEYRQQQTRRTQD